MHQGILLEDLRSQERFREIRRRMALDPRPGVVTKD